MCRCVVVPVVVVCGHFCPVVLVNNNDVTGDRRNLAPTQRHLSGSGPATPWTRNAVGSTHKLCLTSSKPQMSCLIPLLSRVIYSVGNELLIVSPAS